ncbi:hypothetical protein QJS83_10525 [Bdellovibrio sp. 22V]|uniref:hypothetical protein n=1 Tax=Bdellovibrio TaxID=958 RepID=UPI002543BE0E|nr:hypothetical protein [Bdellovibrio sp. 22V]WII70895.1 hypothetical protein QJS83_10525 [Bdellovibrio sp. 22V]
MRAIIFTLVALSFSFAQADLKKVDDFYKESEAAYQKAAKEKTFAKKSSYLKDLKKSFETTLNDYEKTNPKEGSAQEQEVSRLYYTLEPVFDVADLKTASEKDCDKKEQTVRAHASMGQPEGATLPARAQEAIRWLEILCK